MCSKSVIKEVQNHNEVSLHTHEAEYNSNSFKKEPKKENNMCK